MSKPTYDELVAALRAAKRSLGDVYCMCVIPEEMHTLDEDSELVDDVLARVDAA